MSTYDPKATHVRKTFLYDMVSADIWRFRNMRRDSEVLAMSEHIKEQTGKTSRADVNFFYFYALRTVYTDAMYFAWHPDAPAEFTALEEWWNMKESGVDVMQHYDFWINNISNPIANAWYDAVEEAHEIWKPPVEQTGDDETDPN